MKPYLFESLKCFVLLPYFFQKASMFTADLLRVTLKSKLPTEGCLSKTSFKRPRARTEGEAIYNYIMQELKQGETDE